MSNDKETLGLVNFRTSVDITLEELRELFTLLERMAAEVPNNSAILELRNTVLEKIIDLQA